MSDSLEWTFTPGTLRVAFGSEGERPVPAYLGVRRTLMPQQLAGCPPLQLVTRIEIYRLPTADLEVTVKNEPDPGAPGGTCRLIVTVTNLGPDPCPAAELTVVVPVAARITLPRDVPQDGEFTTLRFPVRELAKGAATSVPIEYIKAGTPAGGTEPMEVSVLAIVKSPVFDPDSGNSGRIETTSLRRSP